MRPIPRCIMSQSAILHIPNAVDKYSDTTYTETALSNIHIQPVHDVVKSKDNTELNLNAVLFFDPQVSSPDIDWEEISAVMQSKSRQCKIKYNEKEYTLHSVDFCPDKNGNIHHIELFLY